MNVFRRLFGLTDTPPHIVHMRACEARFKARLAEHKVRDERASAQLRQIREKAAAEYRAAAEQEKS